MKILVKPNLNSKFKKVFAKGYIQNWSEEVFVVSKTKDTVPWTCVISDLNGEPITRSFYEKDLLKTNQEKFRLEKKRISKGDKMYVKWKGYDSRLIVVLIKKTLYNKESMLS